MEAGNWIAAAALVLGVGNLVLYVMRFRREGGRFAAVERRLASQEDRQYLSELSAALIQLRDAAFAHLVAAPDPETERELTSRYDSAQFLAERAPWDNVRRDALQAVVEAGRVKSPHERRTPDAPDELRRDIGRALDAANASIGARMDELRGLAGEAS